MPLVPSKDILLAALRGGYAVGAFNTSNLETTQAILETAALKRSPVIISTSPSALQYAGARMLFGIVNSMAGEMPVPVALHLDHGMDFETVMECIRNGWTSVMIDASKMPFEDNVALTRKVVEAAHAVGVSVEAELGRLVGIEDAVSVSEREATLTDPGEAERFVQAAGCDVLAVAVGTSHGAYKFKGQPRLDFDRLDQISGAVPIPLALHGASGVPREVIEKALKYGASEKLGGAAGVPDEAIRRSIERGIRKINIDTDLRLALVSSLRELLANKPDEIDPRKILKPATEAMKGIVAYKMDLFGSTGRA